MIIIIFFVLQTILYLNVIIKKVSPNLGIFRFIVFFVSEEAELSFRNC